MHKIIKVKTPDVQQLAGLKALSIKQPWAWFVAAGYKPVENRDWPTKFRGRFLIHTGRSNDESAMQNHLWFYDQIKPDLMPASHVFETGGIIGEAVIIDCVKDYPSPWFFGEYGFVITGAALYDKIIPCKGALSFFTPDFESRYKVDPCAGK